MREVGYVVAPGLLPGEAVAALADEIARLTALTPKEARDARYFQTSVVDDRSRILIRIEDFLEDSPAITPMIDHPAIAGPAQAVLADAPLLFKEKINFKPPGAPADTPHYDHCAGWFRYADAFVSVAIAIDANREDNATMSFDDAGVCRRRLIGAPVRRLTEDDLACTRFVPVVLEPGDAVFFDSFVPHQSPCNLGDRPRRNLVLTFNRAASGDQRRRYFDDVARSGIPEDGWR